MSKIDIVGYGARPKGDLLAEIYSLVRGGVPRAPAGRLASFFK